VFVGHDVGRASQPIGKKSHPSPKPVFGVAQRPLFGQNDLFACAFIDWSTLRQGDPHLVQALRQDLWQVSRVLRSIWVRSTG